MARLYKRDEHEGRWSECAVAEPCHPLGESGVAASAPVLHRCATAPHDEAWLLLSEPDGAVAVNGEPVRTGAVTLCDRDEIRLPSGARFFFTTERAAVVESFAADGEDEIRCARCRRWLEPGDAVVRCPAASCGVVHHQSERLPCFTYADSCAVCPQPTTLGSAPLWSPEEL